MKRLVALAVLVLVFTLLGCTPAQPSTFLVSGTIYNHQSQPLAGVQVILGSMTVSTSSQGTFFFSNVQQGNYTLYASKTGYQSFSQSIVVNSNITDLAITMNPTTTTSYDLEVQIHDSTNGTVVNNPTTKLTNTSNNQVIGSTSENPAIFTDLAPSTYQIEVTHPDYQKLTKTITLNSNMVQDLSLVPTSSSDYASASGTVSFASGTSSVQSKTRFKGKTVGLPSSGLSGQYDGILVQFRENTGKENMNQAFSSVKMKNVKNKGHHIYQLDVVNNPHEAVEKLRKNPDVENVQLNYISQLSAIPNDQYFPYQWNLNLIKMPAVWDQVKGQDGDIVVAVLDTGIRPHSDLNANIVAGYDPVNNDTDPYDDVSSSDEGSHGTHVASIIGTVTNNTSLLAGVGWNIKVMPVKVFSKTTAGVGATDADVSEGIYKAVEMGADVINLSLGNHGLPSPADHSVFESALQYAYQHGVTVVAATGNAGANYIDYPASSQYTIAVGAVGHDQVLTTYSNYGSGVDLVAPGGHGAGDTMDQWILGYDSYNGTENLIGMVGTSQATPHVSAVAGLLYTLGVTDPDDILQILIDSATNKNDTTHYGAGILNAEEAVRIALEAPTTPITSVLLFAATITDDGDTITIDPVSPGTSPNSNGFYNLTEIEPGIGGVYIVGIIDFNQNNYLDEGDYFGATAQSYTFANGEHKSGLNFQISKISTTSPNSKKQAAKRYVLSKPVH